MLTPYVEVPLGAWNADTAQIISLKSKIMSGRFRGPVKLEWAITDAARATLLPAF